MRLIAIIALICLTTVGNVSAQKVDTVAYKGILDSLLRTNTEAFGKIIAHLPQYEIQIIYTRIFRDKNNKPYFEHHTFQLDTLQYFNPASTVKLPAIALSLEKLNKLKSKGITANSIVGWGATPCQKKQKAFPARHSLAEYMKRMLLVSDNNGYNRLYDFLGQAYMNNRLKQLGYVDARIIQKFMPCTPEGNRITPKMQFYTTRKKLIYIKPPAQNPVALSVQLPNTSRGKGYYSGRQFIRQPYSFKYSNFLSIKNLHDILTSLLFPQAVPPSRRFDLSKTDYQFLRRYLCMYPRESEFAAYHHKPYNDSYKKYLMYGQNQEVLPDSIRIFNIVGLSYGYQIDCAYIVDYKSNIEFMVSAVINVNENQIYNDGVYAYGRGFGFLKNLGCVLHEYEKAKPKLQKPDLTEFKF